MISDQAKAALKERADLRDIAAQYIALKQEGKDMVGLCPFHKDTNPSLKVNATGYVCFTCNSRGDVFSFIRQVESLSFVAAVNRVAELCGEDAPKHAQAAGAAKFPPRGPCVAKYPYHDAGGKPAYEIRRYEPGEKGRKKDFLPFLPGATRPGIGETQRYLYKLPAVLAASEVWIVEGEKDADTLSTLGIVATSAPFGASNPWLPEFTADLKGRKIIIIPDNDEAGRKRAGEISAHLGFPPVLQLPDAFKDVTDFVTKGGTLEQLKALVPGQTPSLPEAKPEPEKIEFPGWREILLRGDNDKVKPCLANAMTAVRFSREFCDTLKFDAFALRVIAAKPTPWKFMGPWTDTQDSLMTEWLQREIGVMCATSVTHEAVQAVARESSFHPLQEHLNALEWDKKPRCHSWLQTYLGVDPASYGGAVGEIGAQWLIQCVARAFEPGVQADACLILEGKQGKGKSTALRILGGKWFSDDIADLGSKDSKMQLAGKWIIEIAELDSMSRGEISKIKAFMTCRTDFFRPPYGHIAQDFPRQQVFAGSVNDGEYLRDPTGARRFWPVLCGTIDLESLRRDRDQLWAEAVLRYRAKEAWYITEPGALAAAEEEQANRGERDAWSDIVLAFIDQRDDTSIAEIMMQCIEKPLGQWNKADEMRIGRILTRAKWLHKRVRKDGKRPWRYVNPTVDTEQA